ncbi:MAG: hypothetical protein ACTSQP_06435 [Promethearchaeota archaeon]
MSYKRRIGKIKVDFFNMRIEFSPNIEIISKKSQSITGGDEIEEVIISFEVMNNISEKTEPKYKTYVLSADEIEDDEPFDPNNPWYKLEGIELEIVKQDAIPDEPSSVSTHPVAPTPSTTISQSTPSVPETKEASTLSPEKQEKISQIEKQIASLNNMISNLDKNFSSGGISQEEYLKKKNFLAEKLGTLMGQLEALKEE